MFRLERKQSLLGTAFSLCNLTFHVAVHGVRKKHQNAMMGLLMNLFQTVLLIVIFWFLMEVLGMRGAVVRGDFVLYLMTGIFLFMTHTKAIGAVMSAEGPVSSMMKHGPMNTMVSILGSTLGALYLQLLSMAIILFVYHTAWGPITIRDPVGVMAMLLLSWATGVAIGLVFMSIRPWAPEFAGVGQTIFTRINMIASGKMVLVNSLPSTIRQFFDWNPLFHTIDQARGYTFLNYNPRYTSIEYPVYIMLVCLMIGLMAEFYTRQYISASWSARR